MKAYQEQYIANLRRVFELNAPPAQIPSDAAEYVKDRNRRVLQARRLSEENTRLLRGELFPLLDNIITAGPGDVENLEDFAASLQEGAAYLDLVLCYSLHSALIVYARHWGLRDMLIRELYNGAMALFYMQNILSLSGQSRYRLKMSLLFSEAASYIRQYDDIESQETRGYIHRAMGNLALVYSDLTKEDGAKKMAAIRRSLRILTDPAFRDKSPDLPFELYIYKSHQERTTGLGLFRAGIEDHEILREVMESAEYVMDVQLKNCEKQGGQPAHRWRYVYEAAQYHCGVQDLGYLLGWFEKIYMERDEGDYSGEGVYRNMFIPALYAFYLDTSPQYRASKKSVMELMYRRIGKYMRRMPDHQLSESTIKNLIACLQTFVEYPDGILEKDFILDLVVCRSPDTFVASKMASHVAGLMAEYAAQNCPDCLLGALGCDTPQLVKENRLRLRRFAEEGCLLHNVGILPFNHLVRRIGRSWLEEEKEMYECHVLAGRELLDRSESTRPYIQAALGHHRFYSGRDGYPAGYSREDDENAPMTDLISAAVHLVRMVDNRVFLSAEAMGLQDALKIILGEAGDRIAPCWARVLSDLQEPLCEYFKDAQVRAYEEAFRLLRREDGE